MSYGTRLGEFQQESVSSEFQPEELSATKIGTSSEFDADIPPTDPTTEANGEFSLAMENLMGSFQEGDMVKGVVRSVEKGGILVDIGYKSDAFIPNAEFSNDPHVNPADVVKPGDEISGMIEKLESKEGYTLISRKKAEYEEVWNTLSNYAKNKTVVQVKVISRVDGGVVANFMGIKGFIPASQVLKEGEADLGQIVGQILDVTVIQVDRRKRKVVFSRRFAKSKASREEIAKILDNLQVGQVVPGKVQSIKEFGVFVDLGGIEGLVHVSELSWVRVNHPSELVTAGDEVKVYVLGVDKETQRVSLGMKQLVDDPWLTVMDRFAVGQWIDGTVSRIVPFGAFVRIDDHLEGLVHISEISDKRVAKIEDVLQIGQTLNARIIKLSPQEQRIGLTLKPDKASKEQKETEAAPQEQAELQEAAE